MIVGWGRGCRGHCWSLVDGGEKRISCDGNTQRNESSEVMATNSKEHSPCHANTRTQNIRQRYKFIAKNCVRFLCVFSVQQQQPAAVAAATIRAGRGRREMGSLSIKL